MLVINNISSNDVNDTKIGVLKILYSIHYTLYTIYIIIILYFKYIVSLMSGALYTLLSLGFFNDTITSLSVIKCHLTNLK